MSPTSLAAGRPALRATGWMIASIASFVLMTVAARQLTGRMSTFEILFLRSLVALAILLALRPRLGADAFATRRLGLHVARNLVHFCGQYACDFLRLPFIALVALLLYGERVDGWTMLGAVLIFAGNYWSVRAETRAGAPPLLGVTSSTRR